MTGFLAEKIKDHYENNLDLIQALVYADSKQVGKSVYCLLTMKEVYGDWDRVFEHLFFKPENFVEYAKKLVKNNKKVPVLMWDDAGVYAGSDLYFNNKRLYYDLKKIIQVLGTVVQALLVTTPSPDTPTGVLVENRNVTIKITKTDKYQREAKIFSSSTLPWGKKRESKSNFDKFNVIINDEVYERYEKLRNKLTEKSLDMFLENMDSSPDKEQIPSLD